MRLGTEYALFKILFRLPIITIVSIIIVIIIITITRYFKGGGGGKVKRNKWVEFSLPCRVFLDCMYFVFHALILN